VTDKHRDPVFLRNARIIRAQVARAWRLGEDVRCWRCSRVLEPGSPYDVGHINPAGGPGLENLAPEHRHRVGGCRGNRSAGGQLGAAITNARRSSSTPPRRRSSGLLNWRTAGSFFRDRCNPRLRLQQRSLPLNLETP
jgi:hypothetical protein